MPTDALLFERVAQLGAKPDAPAGILRIGKQSITWTPQNPHIAQPVLYSLADVTGQQRAAKDGRAFARLMLRQPDGTVKPAIFAFADAASREEALDLIGSLQQQLGGGTVTPVVLTGPADVVEAKKELLNKDKDLAALYKSLVDPPDPADRLITEPQFWESRMQRIKEALGSRKMRTRKVGLSNDMVKAVQMGDDGSYKIVLTPAIRQQVLAQKPHVARAYQDNVPHKMTKQEFWQKYCRWEFILQKKRKLEYSQQKDGTMDNDDDDEFFRRYIPDDSAPQGPSARWQAEAIPWLAKDASGDKARAKNHATTERLRAVDPTVNLAANVADGFSVGYGTAHNQLKDSTDGHRDRVAFKELVQGLNAHSSVVLTGVPEEVQALARDDSTALAVSAAAAASDGVSASMTPPSGQSLAAQHSSAEWEIRATSGLEDLHKAGHKDNVQPLKIRDRRQVLRIGLTGRTNTPYSGAASTLADALADVHVAALPNPPVPPETAAQVLMQDSDNLQDLANGGLNGTGGPPKHMESVLRPGVMASTEVLRLFWQQAAGPFTYLQGGSQGSSAGPSQGLTIPSDKLRRLRTALSKHYSSLKAFTMVDALPAAERHLVGCIVQPHVDALQHALTVCDTLAMR